MSQVVITLEDNEFGTVNQHVSYGAAFDAASNAHQYSLLMLKLAGDVVNAGFKPNHVEVEKPKLILVGGAD